MIAGEFAKNADGERAVESGSSSLSRDISEDNSQAAAAVGQKIVKIAG
jgi:hypothetical protein